MKKLFILISILIIPLILITCKKDKNETSQEEAKQEPINETFEGSGEFIIDGVEFALNGGNLVYWDDDGDSVFFYKMVLFSSGIRVDDVLGFTGEGHTVYVSMASTQQYIPAMTTYTIIESEEIRSNQINITVAPEYNTADTNKYQADYYTFTTGTFVMSSADGEYEITVDGEGVKNHVTTGEVLEQDIPITMTFDGNIDLNQKK